MIAEDVARYSPIRVFWDGWESDTFRLKRSGWEVFFKSDRSRYLDAQIIQVALTDPDKRMLIAGYYNLSGREALSMGNDYRFIFEHGIKCQSYQLTDRIMTYEEPHRDWWRMSSEFKPCDGLLPANWKAISELPLMQRSNDEGSAIYIDQASVDDCLNRILQVQYPKQEELKMLVTKTPPVIQARIFSIAA